MSTLNPKPRIYSKELFVRDRLQAFKTYPNMDPDFEWMARRLTIYMKLWFFRAFYERFLGVPIVSCKICRLIMLVTYGDGSKFKSKKGPLILVYV